MYIVCSLVGGSGWAKSEEQAYRQPELEEEEEGKKLQLPRLNNETDEEEEERKADL